MTTPATQAVRIAPPAPEAPSAARPVPVPSATSRPAPVLPAPVPLASVSVLPVPALSVPVAAVLPGLMPWPGGRLDGGLPGDVPGRGADGRLFVGRRRELDALTAELAAADRGSSRLVVLEGEPGLGKSALISEFLAGQEQPQLLAASGDEAEQALPFGLVRQLTGGLPGGLPPGCPVLAAGPAAKADPLAAGAELHALLTSRHPAGRRIVVIEDVHWADPQSSRALLYALRRLTGKVLVVVSGRPLGLRRLGEGWVRLLHAERACHRLALAGLGRGELAELAAALGRGSLPGRALRQVAECSEGIPALARALLSEVPDRVLSGPADEIPAPGSVSAPVTSRLAALRDDVAELVIAAAVLGERCALSDAALLAGVPVADDALDLAAEAGFLVAEPVTRQVRFSCELVRRAVYAGTGASRRRSLHRWAAALTEGQDALRHRVAAARGPDLRLAAELDAAAAVAAADAAAGHGEASRAVRCLIQAAELGARGPDRAARILAAFELLVRGGDVAAAQALRPLAEGLPAGTRRDASLGQLSLLAARPAEAEVLLLRAWGAQQQDPPRRVPGPGSGADAPAAADAAAADPVTADAMAAAAAAASLAVLYASAGLPAEAARWADRSAAAASGQQVPPALLAMQAAGWLMAGRVPQARRLLAALPSAAAMVGVPLSDALTVRGMLRLRDGDQDGAADDLAAVAARIRAGLPVSQPGTALGYLAVTSFRLGRWDDCRQAAELAVGMARDSGRVAELPLAHSAAALVPALRGDWQQASAHVLAARQAATAAGTGLAVRHAAAARAVLGFARSDPAEVLDATGPAAMPPGVPGQDDDPLLRLLRPVRIWALIRTGALGPAGRELDELAAHLAGAGDRPGAAYQAWLRASLALAAGVPESAELGRAGSAVPAVPPIRLPGGYSR